MHDVMSDGSSDGLVEYALGDGIAIITMDDGRANALSPAMQASIHSALDRADSDGVAVVLAGRPGRFSAGFDLAVIAAGGSDSVDMVIGGFELALRIVERSRPTVIACTGHAMAMGAFLLLAADYRVGPAGNVKVAANEVAIGMTMPMFAIEMMRYRLTPPGLQRAAVLAEVFDPESAATVGFLDRVVDPDQVVSVARQTAEAHAALHPGAHAATKSRLRAETITRLRTAIDDDRRALSAALA